MDYRFLQANFGRRSSGGWKGKMDVVGYNPSTQEFLHIETSTDANSRKLREKRFKKKFRDAKEHYRELFPFKGERLKQVAIIGFNTPRTPLNFGNGVEIISIRDFIRQITQELREKNPAQDAIPETYPLLRAIQYAMFYTR